MESKQAGLILDVYDKPSTGKGLLLSIQHIFAMFGATILVPLVVGLPVSVALFASGVGTLVYQFLTQQKVPVYLGSSFAYISAMQIAIQQMGGDLSASQTGIILTGLAYVLIAGLIAVFGTDWLNRIMPPIVIGPMIMVIGLGLSATAIENSGLVTGGSWREILVALVTFLVTAFVNTRAKGFMKIIPFLVGVVAGYLLSVFLGLVDFSPVLEAEWFALPDFYFPFETQAFHSYDLYFGPETWAILPLVLATAAEHVGDHAMLGEICKKDFIDDPGLTRTLMGDGLATALSAFFGGPANTTYGENVGVIGMTRIASVSVVRNAAILAVIISFLGKFTALISTIPDPVLGGMSIILYGVIASSGLKVMIEDRTDFNKPRNLIIASAMLVIGIGGAVLDIGLVTLSGTVLSALVGIVLNLILPKDQDFQGDYLKDK
ncbi:Uracil transporter [Alloiococcus otitis]|uniref:Uracil-xanthine permease n=1 Tax=Alloiococcus otitis ATCC 51267 TaxID=883081 RepID=K9ECX5_9LACT|nr:solute carrier family 23 protein [Alloiococcus otitis]EKU93706.1 uracil-xanthine permease [Alloiococcus otitis ATCC 51267]SUU80302.1 Uracil transporter [Alloiococcus otitis]